MKIKIRYTNDDIGGHIPIAEIKCTNYDTYQDSEGIKLLIDNSIEILVSSECEIITEY